MAGRRYSKYQRSTETQWAAWESTAPRLAGSLDKDFWARTVLQLAQSEPFVLDSVIVISTLYEHPQYLDSFQSMETTQQPIGDGHLTNGLDRHHADALKAYNRALKGFRLKFENGKATIVLALFSAVMFLCIEIIRDDIFAALGVFSKAHELLKQFDAVGLIGQEAQLYRVIQQMFARLGVLAAAFGHGQSQPQDSPLTFDVTCQHQVFANMTDARTALFALMAETHPVIQDAASYKASSDGHSTSDSTTDQGDRVSVYKQTESFEGRIPTPSDWLHQSDGHGFDNIIDFTLSSWEETHAKQPESLPELQDDQRRLEMRLNEWYEALHWTRSSTPDCEPEAASNPLMYYHVSSVWLSSRLAPLQTAFDEYTYHFQRVLHHAEIYVNAKSLRTALFTFEVRAVPPLYFVATKCRIPSFRRKALQLPAKAPRKECMWGAMSTGQLAARVVAVEEEGLGLPVPLWNGESIDDTLPIIDAILPSEPKRVHNLELLKNNASGSFEVRVTRYSELDGSICKLVQDYPI